MPLDTRRMLADQLYAVLMMTLVEGESFDILVGSGSGGGLEAWRSLAASTQALGPLDDWKSERIAQRTLSPGRAKLVELQGAVERLT